MESDLQTYEVKSRISHDGRRYLPGDTIELTEDQAKRMPWAVKATVAPQTVAEKPKLPSVKEVVAQVSAIEDATERLIAADDLLKAELEREDPPARSTLVSQLEEIIAKAQEGDDEEE